MTETLASSLIELQRVHKRYHGEPILGGVSLRVDSDSRLALLGRNGAGKTTLMKILAGVEEPDEGSVDRVRDLRVGYLEQVPKLPTQATVREVVASGLAERDDVQAALERLHDRLSQESNPDRLETLLKEQERLDTRLDALGGHDIEHRIDSTIEHLGLHDPSALCEHLSGGEQRRVALAKLLLAPPDLWLLDEPTNHLDTVAIDWLEDFLLAARTPFVLVTHDRYFLDRVVTRIAEIEHARIVEYEGGYSDFVVQKAEREAIERHAEGVRQNLLRRETAWMRRGPPARTTKAKARIQRYQTLVQDAPDGPLAALEFQIPPGPRLGKKCIELRGVSHGFGDRLLFDGLDLEIAPNMRLGVVGPNGVGKTTLMNIARRISTPDRGEVIHGETVRIAAIDQKREDLDPDATVQEQVAGDRRVIDVGGREQRVETFLERFLFKGERKHAKIKDLSGGERQRVLLAMLLSAGGNVLFLDEPTNDLDLVTLRVLEEALIDFAGAVVVVSHDRWFLDRVATHVLWFDEDGTVGLHEGDVSSLLQRRAADRAEAERRTKGGVRAASGNPASSAASNAAPRSSKVPTIRWTSKERNEARDLPAKIEALEKKIAELDTKLADPALYADGKDRSAPLIAERQRHSEVLHRLYARWEELETGRPG